MKDIDQLSRPHQATRTRGADTRMLWFVCPIYFDVESFFILRKRILLAMQSSSAAFDGIRFVAVDDTGGIDSATESLKDLRDVQVIKAPFNLGHQRAIVYGLRHLDALASPTDFIVTLDADGEDQPEDVPRILDPLLQDDLDLKALSLARRTKRSESLLFKICYACFKASFRILTGSVIRSGNFAAYRGWMLGVIRSNPTFDLCYSSSLARLKLTKRHDVPCERGERYRGQSKMNYEALIMHGFRMLMPFVDRIAIRALIFFSVVSSLGIGLSGVVIVTGLLTNLVIPGWAAAALLVLFLISIVALGQFAVLFTLFTHMSGMLLRQIDVRDEDTIPEGAA